MDAKAREGHQGTGPGAITPDGCAVEMYARLPAGDEPEIVASTVPAGSRLLELGSGAGRVTRPLVERGFDVVAVDESPEMLAYVQGARTVCSPIETLDLKERFDVVLLGSFLVNTADEALCSALLRSCARHVEPDGCVLVQRENDRWHEEATVPREWERGGQRIRLASVEHQGTDRVAVRMEYAYEGAEWTHSFVSRVLPDAAFEAELGAAGLALDAYVTDDHSWVRAVPAPRG
ncbi:class I SAM-dependent methyltransferase [Streptomyces zagrosensis]|uniref:SAM-dependent methyltransferase n=1 Tax=Streptomyces zagrosensis TaxID=1042984 RepID=A0A7W9QAQ6_9ACTN|nr:methyltransferase domain-containing protein [Streptomyces zagrosensis]MBB5935557.1 SAM-dependent methyltransferase [Streptomyces zagrosensis]